MMFQNPIIINKNIKIKYCAAPRSGTHFFEAIINEINKQNYDYFTMKDLDLSHSFKTVDDCWNLVTSLRDPKESIASHAALIINVVKGKPVDEVNNMAIKSAINYNEEWYEMALKEINKFVYIFDFNDLIKNTKNNIDSFLKLFEINNITDNINFDSLYNTIHDSKKDNFLKTSKNELMYQQLLNMLDQYDLSKSYNAFNIINKFRIDSI